MRKKIGLFIQSLAIWHVDQIILLFYTITVLTGLTFIYSVSPFSGKILHLSEHHLFLKQLLFVVISVFSMLIFSCIDYKFTRKHIKFFVFFSLLLLLSVFIPGIGLEQGPAKRWINFYFFSFNPSEFAKLVLIIYFAHILVKKQNSITNFVFGLLPPLILGGAVFAISLLQSGFSIGILVISIMFSMVFIGGASLWHLSGIILLSVPIICAAIFMVSYRVNRIFSYFNLWENRTTFGYQSIQSLQALANGKFFGVGIGNSSQKVSRLPAAHTDFIFSIIVEETGLIGGIFIIALFATFFYLGMKITHKTTDIYGKFLAFGIVSFITIHAILNIMIALVIIPPTGVSLPFISYGGSSFLTSSIAMGILLNISAQNNLYGVSENL